MQRGPGLEDLDTVLYSYLVAMLERRDVVSLLLTSIRISRKVAQLINHPSYWVTKLVQLLNLDMKDVVPPPGNLAKLLYHYNYRCECNDELKRYMTGALGTDGFSTFLRHIPSDEHIEEFRLILQPSSGWERIDPAANDNNAIRNACEYGDAELLALLLKDSRVDPNELYGNLLEIVCSNKYGEDLVRLLLEDGRVDPSAERSLALRIACKRGDDEVVKLLLDDGRADPTSGKDEDSLEAAIMGWNASTVRLLLADPRVDPSENNNWALKQACRYGSSYEVEALLEDKRVDPSDNGVMEAAIESGDPEILELLLSSINGAGTRVS